MAKVEIKMGEIGGGADMSVLFGKVVAENWPSTGTSQPLCPTVGVNTITIKGIYSSATIEIYGYDASENSTLIGSYTIGLNAEQDVDVSSYVRVGITRTVGSSAGYHVYFKD